MTVRIGCASGFWGDSQIAAGQLVHGGRLDYLVLDYLAEVTMGILARAGSVSADGGYATDFVTTVMAPLAAELAERRIRVVTNAGGVNVRACRDAVARAAERAGASLRIAVVEGDDLLPRLEELRPRISIASGPPLPAAEELLNANCYLGAPPIARALAEGADVVITGRTVDSALALGPLMHEFGWTPEDFDRLAAGCLAGHVIECGAQATGGLFTDWTEVPSWDRIGYPIVECYEDGRFVLGKPPGTGGLVTPATVAEQILYEIGDPASYELPDVIADFSGVRLEQSGEDRVAVAGARGRPPSGRYKLTATVPDGYRTTALAMLTGIDAVAKAERVADAMLARVRRMLRDAGLDDFRNSRVEVLGAEALYGPHGRRRDTREVVLRIAVHHDQRRAVSIFAKEIASAGTSFAPGLSGLVGGRARPAPLLQLITGFVDREAIATTVTIGDRTIELAAPAAPSPSTPAAPHLAKPERPLAAAPDADGAGDATPTASVPLVALAHGRSGDKGNDGNVGIIAREAEFVPLLRSQLTAERVAEHLAHLLEGGAAGRVERYECPGLAAFNFVLRDALGGGGLASLRYDAQGKALAQLLLDMPIEVPRSWLAPGGRLADDDGPA